MLRKALILVGVLVFVSAAYRLLRSDSPVPSEPAPAATELRSTTQRSKAQPSLVEPARLPEPGAGQTRRPASAVPATSPRLPFLGESDPFVRELLRALPLPEEWTSKDDLLRHLAALVDGMTRDEIPRRQLGFLRPEGRFQVVMRNGRFYADPANSQRFDLYLDRLEVIDPAMLASLLDTLRPLIDVAVAELGGEMTGRETILGAIDRVLETPIRRDTLELVRPKVFYEYADEDLELLPPLEKQLLRLGPANLERLQSYLLELRTGLHSN